MPFQPHKWNQTFTVNRVKLPTPTLKVVLFVRIIVSLSLSISLSTLSGVILPTIQLLIVDSKTLTIVVYISIASVNFF